MILFALLSLVLPVLAQSAPPEPAPRTAISASLSLEALDVKEAQEKVARLARDHGGEPLSESWDSYGGSAALRVRIPQSQWEAFQRDLEVLGGLVSVSITPVDPNPDLEARSLRLALDRYQDLLAHASTLSETTAAEAEIQRVQARLAELGANGPVLEADRVQVDISITTRFEEEDVQEARFFPGVRASHLVVGDGLGASRALAGPGLSAWFFRSLHFDLDLMTDLPEPQAALDGVVVTLGGDIYSDFLGGGQRRFLNPHLGLAMGYASLSGQERWTSHAVASGVAGVELLHLPMALVDVNGRFMGLLNEDDNRMGWQTTVSGHLAF